MRRQSNRSLTLGLIVLAVVSFAGLDYIQSRQGRPAWVFKSVTINPRTASPKALPSPTSRAAPDSILLNPSEIVISQATDLGIPPESISQYRDSEGIHHMMLEVTPEQYRTLEPLLDRNLERAQAEANKEERRQEQGKVYYLWRIRDKHHQLLSLLISCHPPQAEEAGRGEPAQAAAGKLAIIIDDMGNSLDAIEKVSQLRKAFTVAILPYSPLAQETAAIARQNNLEVILHLPLESLYNDYDNKHTEGIIHSAMSRDQIIASVEKSLGRVPFIDGVNTHMGSKITSEPELIRVVLEQLKNRGLYFIDSRTTAQSVAFDEAQRMGIPSAYRNVFLDSEINEAFIRNQFLLLCRYAQQHGLAVGICHPSPETLKVLRENVSLVDQFDLEMVFASEIVTALPDVSPPARR